MLETPNSAHLMPLKMINAFVSVSKLYSIIVSDTRLFFFGESSVNRCYPLKEWATLNGRNHADWGGELAIKNSSPIEQKNILCHTYSRYIYQTDTVRFSISSTIMRTNFNLYIANITEANLLGYVIYFSADAVCIS